MGKGGREVRWGKREQSGGREGTVMLGRKGGNKGGIKRGGNGEKEDIGKEGNG